MIIINLYLLYTAIDFVVMYVDLYFNDIQMAKSKLKSRIRLDLENQN